MLVAPVRYTHPVHVPSWLVHLPSPFQVPFGHVKSTYPLKKSLLHDSDAPVGCTSPQNPNACRTIPIRPSVGITSKHTGHAFSARFYCFRAFFNRPLTCHVHLSIEQASNSCSRCTRPAARVRLTHPSQCFVKIDTQVAW